MPAIPAAGSIKPDAARFIFCTVALASSGVAAALLASIGPALPSSFRLPSAGSCAVILKGKDEAKEKLVTSILTLSYTRGFSFDSARDIVRRPSFMFSFATDKFGFPPEEAGAAGFAADVLFPPRLEKFHLSPFSDFTRLISGCFKVISVTFRVLEKISGIISTPTLKDLACTNGDLLKVGSSAMEMLSAEKLPENSERDRLPTLTGRPKASVSSDSSLGRKVFASIKNGIAMATTTRAPTIIARIFRVRFMRCTSCQNDEIAVRLRELETLHAASPYAPSVSLRLLH